MELTTVRAQEKACTYGIPVALGQLKHNGRGHWAQRCEGSQRRTYRRGNNVKRRREHVSRCECQKNFTAWIVVPKGWTVGPFAERQERKQGILPKKRNVRVRYVGHGKLTWGHLLYGERETIKTRGSTQASGHYWSKGRRERAWNERKQRTLPKIMSGSARLDLKGWRGTIGRKAKL